MNDNTDMDNLFHLTKIPCNEEEDDAQRAEEERLQKRFLQIRKSDRKPFCNEILAMLGQHRFSSHAFPRRNVTFSVLQERLQAFNVRKLEENGFTDSNVTSAGALSMQFKAQMTSK